MPEGITPLLWWLFRYKILKTALFQKWAGLNTIQKVYGWVQKGFVPSLIWGGTLVENCSLNIECDQVTLGIGKLQFLQQPSLLATFYETTYRQLIEDIFINKFWSIYYKGTQIQYCTSLSTRMWMSPNYLPAHYLLYVHTIYMTCWSSPRDPWICASLFWVSNSSRIKSPSTDPPHSNW